jgi:16S rRNA (cytidine1402-2'-O)-methyltransferase
MFIQHIANTVLYLVPTPIGNLDDITYRAVKVLKEVDTILAEDTRTTGQLLKHLEIKKPLQSYHIFNEHHTVEKLIERLKNGEKMALVSDAGTPAISDPGFLLVRECLKHELAVECLPGAVAFIPALVKSGFPTDSFLFEGFLPHKKGRQTKMLQLCKENRTIIFYESPHRLVKTLQQLSEHFGTERLCSVSREISKMHEETTNGTLAEVLKYYQDKGVKGEIVLLVKGLEGKRIETSEEDEEE